MIHPDTRLVHISDEIGMGIVATAFLPKGTITWVQDAFDQVFHPSQLSSFPGHFQPTLEKYTFRNREGLLVLCWDAAKYMNHSCVPTCLGTEFGFEIAIRDIHPGEELTDDYATFFMEPEDQFDCYCGTPECRTAVRPEDLNFCAPRWENLLKEALPFSYQVPQKMSNLLNPELIEKAQKEVFFSNQRKTG